MMATGSGGISSLPAPRSMMLQQQLVRLLLVALVLLAIVGPHGGRAASVGATAAVSLAEDEDSSAAVGASDEMVADESFEQDVSQAPHAKEAPGGAQRADESEAAGSGDWQDSQDSTERSTMPGFSAVATTPKIVPVVKQLSRYEQGLEDYDEAADRAEREQQQQQQEQQEQDTEPQSYSNMVKPMLTLFNVISTVLSSGRSMRSMLSGLASTDGDNKNVNITLGGGDSTSHGSSSSSSGADNETETATAMTGGRYIKGDPLNGYFDFVISEGSYKFWVVFQLFTCALVLYATFAAIYYSKVSPLTSDYDYIDYLNGARSFAGGRSMTGTGGGGVGGRGMGAIWDTVANNWWFGPAAQAFETVMHAIENAPK